jgi:hypothetical protein
MSLDRAVLRVSREKRAEPAAAQEVAAYLVGQGLHPFMCAIDLGLRRRPAFRVDPHVTSYPSAARRVAAGGAAKLSFRRRGSPRRARKTPARNQRRQPKQEPYLSAIVNRRIRANNLAATNRPPQCAGMSSDESSSYGDDRGRHHRSHR